ncbi:MAG: PrsW family intramembrane metalloprotease [Thermoleophilia bacterium]|nr:PrsW family intramembrane metalloprotease [Thermoleophilia bacterium]
MHKTTSDVAPEVPEKIALVMRRQRRSLRTLRAEGVVLPVLLLVLVLTTTTLSGIVPAVLGLLLAFVPVPLVAAILLRLDRFEPEPTSLLLRTFLWGAGAATFIALVINTAVGLAIGETGAAVASAPIVEESAKALALLFVIWRRPGMLDGVHDGIVYAAWVALGFATVENILYYASAWNDGGAEQLSGTFVLRGLMTPLCHPIFTAMTGIALGIAIKRRGGRGGKLVIVLIGLLVAMLLHALWNLSAGVGAVSIAYLAGYVPLAAIGIALLTMGARRERRILQKGLEQEVARGTLTQAAYRQLVAGGRARGRMRRRARRAGREARRLLYQYEASAYELAHANVGGDRPGRPDVAETAGACRACLADARRGLDELAPGLVAS